MNDRHCDKLLVAKNCRRLQQTTFNFRIQHSVGGFNVRLETDKPVVRDFPQSDQVNNAAVFDTGRYRFDSYRLDFIIHNRFLIPWCIA
jgi:hypothetical protein